MTQSKRHAYLAATLVAFLSGSPAMADAPVDLGSDRAASGSVTERIDALRTAARSGSVHGRREAILTLAETRREEALPFLLELRADPSLPRALRSLLCGLTHVLGGPRVGDEGHAEFIRSTLADAPCGPEGWLQEWALRHASDLGTPHDRGLIADGLERLASERRARRLEAELTTRFEFAARGTAGLAEALRDERSWVQAWALDLAVRRGTAAEASVLTAFLDEKAEELRSAGCSDPTEDSCAAFLRRWSPPFAGCVTALAHVQGASQLPRRFVVHLLNMANSHSWRPSDPITGRRKR